MLDRKLLTGDRVMLAHVTLKKGCLVIHLPSNVWHKAEALEETTVLDVFSPPWQDWLDKTDAYLRR